MTYLRPHTVLALLFATSLAPRTSSTTAVPSISGLTPSSAIVGTNGLRVTVNGANFARTSVVRWKGVDRPTTFVSVSQLQVDIPAADLGTVGTAQVTVFTPGGNGGTSNVATFTAGNPLPVLATFAPQVAMAGGEPFGLVVVGSNFVAGSVVQWNGVARQTTFQGTTRLSASISSSDLANEGTAQIKVFTPPPLGGSSATASVLIAVHRPTITSLDPASRNFGLARGLTMRVAGRNFIRSAVVRWNGQPRATTWVSPTQLTAVIPDRDVDSLVPVSVTVLQTVAAAQRESAPTAFAITYPLPSITGHSPSRLDIGVPIPLFAISGTGFTKQSVVTLNGRQVSMSPDAPYTTLSTGTRIFIPTTDPPGQGVITVTNPAPGGGTATFGFPLRYPPPMLSSLTPSTVAPGRGAFTLVVKGMWFRQGYQVRWNGSPRPTTYVGFNELRVAISAADIARVGVATIDLQDAALFGSSANKMTLSIAYPAIMVPR